MNNKTFEVSDLKDVHDCFVNKPIHTKPKYHATIESLCNMSDEDFIRILNEFYVSYSVKTGLYILGRYNNLITKK